MSEPEKSRVQRVERLAWLLDNAIPLPGGYRVGIESLLGLVPGIGELLSGLLSGYIVLEGVRLGASRGVVSRMAGNVALDLAIGAVPVLGDVFDFAFKANARNVTLLREHLGSVPDTARMPRSRKARRGLVTAVVAGLVVVLVAAAALSVVLVLWLVSLLGGA